MFLRIVLGLLLSVQLSSAQQLFNLVAGTTGTDYGYSGKEIYDYGFMVLGSTGIGSTGNSDILMMRVSASGNLKWQKAIGFNQVDQCYSIETDIDSGYFLGGYTNSIGAGGYDVLLMKTDTLANISWTKTFGGSDWDFAYKMIKNSNGDLLLAGQTFSGATQNGDAYLVKTDDQGNLLWEKTYGGADEDVIKSMRQTTDGGYILCGQSKSFSGGNQDLYLVRTDANGTMIWERNFGDSISMTAYDVIENYDGGFIVVGEGQYWPDSVKTLGFIMRVSAGGSLMKIDYPVNNRRDVLYNLCIRSSSTFFAVGETNYQTNGDYNLNVLDTTATITRGRTHGGAGRDYGMFISPTSSNTFLTVGTSRSYYPNSNDNVLITTFNDTGYTVAPAATVVYVGIEEQSSEKPLIMNSGTDHVRLVMKSVSNANVQLYSIDGRKVNCSAQITNAANFAIELDLSDLPSAMYVLSISGENDFRYTTKLVKP